MPAGRVHTKHTIVASVIILCWAPIDVRTSILASIGCLSGVLLSPDLDVDNGNISMYFLRRVHPLLSWTWKKYWLPYARLIKHRSRISHLPILSTAIRLLYIVPAIYFVIFISSELGLKFSTNLDIISLLSFFLGLAVSDSIHWLADQIF